MKRTNFFKTVLLLVAFNAAIAIFALLGGDMGETGGKILGSSLLATMGAVLALMCAPAVTAKRAWFWPEIGMAAAAVSAGLFIFAVWAEPAEEFFQTAASVLVLAVTAAIISLLSAWPGSRGLGWVRIAATWLAIAGGAMIVLAIWNGGDLPDGYWRSFGVVMVLLAAAFIATPVVHRMTDSGESGEPTAITNCPFDGTKVDGTVGQRLTCPKCGRKFVVRLG